MSEVKRIKLLCGNFELMTVPLNDLTRAETLDLVFKEMERRDRVTAKTNEYRIFLPTYCQD